MHRGGQLKIASIGRYLPERIVTDTEIEQYAHLKQGWVKRKTGVAERRWTSGESQLFMGAQAAQDALIKGNIGKDDIDLIINASATPYMSLPDTSCMMQEELGMGNTGIPCFSIHATCLSFLMALNVASSFIAARIYSTILIISSEIGSSSINFDEPESASLFGDMATAVIVTASSADTNSGIQAWRHETYGEGSDLCVVRGGGTYRHPNDPQTIKEDNLFHMDGPKVFRLAHKYMPGFLEGLRPGLSKGLGTINMVVPHQASLLSIRSMQKLFNIPDESIIINIERFGNCIAASIPGALYDGVSEGRIHRGDEILLVGTGAGFSMAGAILTY